ncbi:MAG TPA: hypothetical protein VFN30_15230 [Chitinophagaceae bacterium]|nr:hypothetical protein [Chitinophagaceae bacterium]
MKAIFKNITYPQQKGKCEQILSIKKLCTPGEKDNYRNHLKDFAPISTQEMGRNGDAVIFQKIVLVI